MPAIGVDVGGTKIAAGVVGEDGALIVRHELPTDADHPEAIVGAIVKVVREVRAAAPAAACIGIGAAGLVDPVAGVVLGAPNIAYRNLPLRALVAERTGLPVAIDNDANVAALAEATHGAGAAYGDQLMITVGTGIGGGIIIGGRVFRGARGIGAEVGHIVVSSDGPRCGCGNRGCLEAFASGTALGRIARERIDAHPDSAVIKLAGGDPQAITGALVGDAALGGDAFALSCISEAGRWLGIGLGSLVNVFDPEILVLGGGVVAGLGELLVEPARRSMREHTIGLDLRPEVPLVPAALGADAGIIGAAVLARTSLEGGG